MNMIQKRLKDAQEWQENLTPYVQGRMLKYAGICRKFSCFHAGNKEYEVNGDVLNWMVDLGKLTCDCQEWQISGIPCPHAVLCINHYATHMGKAVDYGQYLYPELTIDAYIKTYTTMIHPVPHKSRWDDVPGAAVGPPNYGKRAGRPKKIRKREEGEARAGGKRFTVKCAMCKGTGHNKRSCKTPESAILLKKKKTRTKVQASETGPRTGITIREPASEPVLSQAASNAEGAAGSKGKENVRLVADRIIWSQLRGRFNVP